MFGLLFWCGWWLVFIVVWGVVCGVACVDCVVLGYVVLRGMFAAC